MKNIFKFALMTAVAALLYGCRDGDVLPDTGPELVSVYVETFAAIGSTVDGITLGSVRMIAVDGSDRVVFNRFTADGVSGLKFEDRNYAGDLSGDYTVSLFPGDYDFYVVVNELSGQSAALDAVTKGTDLTAIKLSPEEISGLSEATMVCVGRAAIKVRDNPNGNVSTDGGTTWSGKLNVKFERAAAKLTVKVRKNSVNVNDAFTITGATVSNMPQYSYLLPKEYDGAEPDITASMPVIGENAEFTGSATEYAEVVEGFILPEYLMGDSPDGEKAPQLVLTADYSVNGGTADQVAYTIPLRGNTSNYDLERNRHYILSVSINNRGEFEYTPYIVYEVADWYEASEDPSNVDLGGVSVFTIRWVENPDLDPDDEYTAFVSANRYVALEFEMTSGTATMWSAHLSDPENFYLDETGGAVISGIAKKDHVNRIVVRPKKETSLDNLFTELYIIINDGIKEEIYDLNGSEKEGNSYIIRQLPTI